MYVLFVREVSVL